MQFTFNQVKHVGEWAVGRFSLYLTKNGREMYDVQDSPLFRDMDIDLVIAGKFGDEGDGLVTLIEVKGDRHKPENFYIETVSNVERAKIGCMMYTQSDYIAYYFVNYGECFLIPTKPFQEWMKSHLTTHTMKMVENKHYGGNVSTSYGYIVPVNVILGAVPGTLKIRHLPKMGDTQA